MGPDLKVEENRHEDKRIT